MSRLSYPDLPPLHFHRSQPNRCAAGEQEGFFAIGNRASIAARHWPEHPPEESQRCVVESAWCLRTTIRAATRDPPDAKCAVKVAELRPRQTDRAEEGMAAREIDRGAQHDREHECGGRAEHQKCPYPLLLRGQGDHGKPHRCGPQTLGRDEEPRPQREPTSKRKPQDSPLLRPRLRLHSFSTSGRRVPGKSDDRPYAAV